MKRYLDTITETPAPCPPLMLGDTAPKFELGSIVATPGAIITAECAGVSLYALLREHARGNWGDLCPEDRQINEWAIDHEARLLSCYWAGTQRLWVITEADSSLTTFLLPSEY